MNGVTRLARVVVTGSSGQIGSFVVDALGASGHDAVGLDVVPSRWTDVVGDVRDPAAVARAVAGADAVVHLAALVSVPKSVEEPAGDALTNLVGTLHILEAARRAGVASTVFVSSCAVYGEPQTLPVTEEARCRPMSPYGQGKLAAEGYALLYHRLHGMGVHAVRPFNVYSERQKPGDAYAGVIPVFLERVRAGERPRVFGDGSQTRDFVHAEDVAAFLVKLAVDPPRETGRVYNVGTGHATRIGDLARAAMRAAGMDGEPEFAPARPGDVLHSVASIAAARSIGFRPTRSIESFVKAQIASPGGGA